MLLLQQQLLKRLDLFILLYQPGLQLLNFDLQGLEQVSKSLHGSRSRKYSFRILEGAYVITENSFLALILLLYRNSLEARFFIGA